ncbi:hypothetical protein ACSNOH_30930 [Streptomyces sp. URMC 127]|uniref:hypothetical protein n=1 Tax=Streptomyces sp. URMC 127 TaxID=3423402 RepID=UPI003F1D2447
MSTATVTRIAPAARRTRTAGTAWVVWRRHRTTAWIALAVLAVLCAELLWLRGAMTDYVARHGLDRPCPPAGQCFARQQAAVEGFRTGYGDLLFSNGLLLTFLPVLAGLFVAGPVIARELESGMYKVAWTQSVPPLRWFAAKLGLPVAALLAGVSALSAAYTWAWRSVAGVASGELVEGFRWYESFDALGPAPVAGTLAGAALGALTGLLVRRTLPAMAVAAAACVAAYWPLSAVRPHLVGALTSPGRQAPGPAGADAWVYERGMTTASGGRLPEPGCATLPWPEQCLTRNGGTGWYVDYHPAAHFWSLQWAQAGLLTAAAAVLTGAAVWWLRRVSP